MTTGAQPPSPARPRRSRLRTFLPLGLAGWLLLEISLLAMVAGASNGPVVFLILVAGAVLGTVVVKRAGRRAFRSLTETLQQQGGSAPAPGPNSEGNGLMMLGGLLLIVPGLVSDVLGLALLVPPLQKAVGRYAERTFERKLRQAVQGSFGDAFQQARIHRPDGKVVPGEVVRDGSGSVPGDASPGPRPPLTR
ncbi:FxsA family membrane protein [Streptomyces sp. NPDC014986]|uniref:FxsA family membrane protein n=1 Tax=Streptomyces sp. NPDC014986 TaxID=3364934 RepID=UPI0036F5248A